MSQKYNQPTSSPQGIISDPIDGRRDSSKKFCTGKFHPIGTHAGFIIGAYDNKDGSHGFVITDGTSSFWIDEGRNIHIQTGSTDNDGLGSGGLIFTGDKLTQKVKTYFLEVEGNDDEEKLSAEGTSKKPPFSISVYGDIAISSTGGDVKISGDNILLNAKEQVKIKSGAQTLIEASGGGGKVDIVANEFTTNASTAKFDLTSAFYVEGPEEVTFNQKYKVSPINGEFSINSLGAVIAQNTMGGKSSILIGNNKISSTGNLQIEANKLLTTTISGDSKISLGPISDYSLAQYDGVFVGTPRENSRSLIAYSLFTGGAIGTSYSHVANDINLLSLGTLTSTSVSATDFIGSLILLN